MLTYHRDSLQQFNDGDLGACAGEWDPNEQNRIGNRIGQNVVWVFGERGEVSKRRVN